MTVFLENITKTLKWQEVSKWDFQNLNKWAEIIECYCTKLLYSFEQPTWARHV